MRLVDLSQVFEDGMPGFRLKNEDGSYTEYTARIRPFLTHEQSRPKYGNQCSFEITEILCQTSIGTYLDSPYHRYPTGRDIAALDLTEVILPGVVIDARNRAAFEPVGPEVIDRTMDLKGKAVLFSFGWDRHWGTEQYYSYPYISRETLQLMIDQGVKLVGVDALTADDSRDLSRPVHTELLARDILIVENLRNLDLLHGVAFRFFAVPLKARRVAAMPVRAFAAVG